MNTKENKENQGTFKKGDTAYIKFLDGFHQVKIQNVFYHVKLKGRIQKVYTIKLYEDTAHEHTVTERDLFPVIEEIFTVSKNRQ